MARRIRRAFTLIELMIVVVIIAFISAALVPLTLGRLKRDPAQPPAPAGGLEQRPPLIAAQNATGGAAPPPQIVRTDLQVSLQTQPELDGIRVRTRYRAKLVADFEIDRIDPTAQTMSIDLPFPQGIREARDVSLQVAPPGAELVEPAGVVYALDGVRWTTAAQPMAVRVSYSVIGSDAFVYDLTAGGRSGKVRVALELDPEAEAIVPARSLEPSERSGQMIIWSFDRLIAERPIALELPAGSSPLGRLVLLFRLAALAVLLFGAGFWYLSEEKRPGALDGFRWGHFLLLATTFASFFPTFAVLSQHLSTAAATIGAAAMSLPLLVVHLTRVMDANFALTRALPLGIYSLGAVVTAVFFDHHRALVLLFSVLIPLGYVTLGYQRWSTKRRAHQEAVKARKEKEAARARAEQERAQAEKNAAITLEAAIEEEAPSMVSIDRALAIASSEAGKPHDLLISRADVLRQALEQLDRLRAVSGVDPKRLAADAERATREIRQARGDLDAALQEVERSRRGAMIFVRCASCGARMDPEAAFCSSCGAPSHALAAISRLNSGASRSTKDR